MFVAMNAAWCAAPATPGDESGRQAAFEQQEALRWLHEAVGGLVQHGEVDDLFAAALVAAALGDPSDIARAVAVPEPPELLRFAKARAPHDPLLAWASLMTDRERRDANLTVAEDEATLVALDPDNAYVGLLQLASADRRGDAVAARAALARAARATRYDDYVWSVEKRIYNALGRPDETAGDALLAPESEAAEHSSPKEMRSILSLGVAQRFAMPMLTPLRAACGGKDGGMVGADVRADCRAVAYLMMDRSSSLISWRVGNDLARRLADDAAERDTLALEALRIDWLLAKSDGMGFSVGLPGDGDLHTLSDALAKRFESENEITAMEAELTRRGIELSPPACADRGPPDDEASRPTGMCTK